MGQKSPALSQAFAKLQKPFVWGGPLTKLILWTQRLLWRVFAVVSCLELFRLASLPEVSLSPFVHSSC